MKAFYFCNFAKFDICYRIFVSCGTFSGSFNKSKLYGIATNLLYEDIFASQIKLHFSSQA